MAPPSQRYTSSRGRISHQSSNYRGRISTRGRGTSFRVGASRSELMMSRKRALTSTLEYRRKLLTSRSRDYIQRVRLASTKMRRSGTTRQSGSKKESTTSSSVKDKDRELAKAINAEFSDDDEDKDAEENWEVDDKTLQTEEDEEVTNNDAEKKSKDEKRKKDKPERQNVEEREEEKDQEMKEGDDEVKQEREEDEAEGERDENEKAEGSADGLPNRRDGRRFIKLHCPHCAHHDRLTTGNGDAEGDSSGPGEDDKEVNLDNFMTLDSVGDVDAEEEEEAAGDKKKKDKPEGSENNTSSEVPEKKLLKNKQMIKVGAEYVKLVEAQFCELCKMYLPRNENIEKALAFHCSTRSHLKRYVRDNDDKALRRQAERIHLQTSTPSVNNTSATSTTSETTKPTSSSPTPTNAGVNSTPPNADVSAESEQTNEQPINATEIEVDKSNKPVNKNGEEEEEDDFHNDGDKLWEDVDKDLGDILREVEPGKSSDDEDSRYDRFKNSEKKIQQLQHLKEKANDLAEIEESKKLETKIKAEKIEK
ncbi:hypothetical protein PV327_003752 [Microctonus hyperodae]|nr:hypothetical protein PV327_003752 [Microctonus hyperodae]